MKKVFLTTCILLGLGVTQSVIATGTASPGGRITFNGKVTDATCIINQKDNGNMTVRLPTVTKTALSENGKTAGETSFKISLSGCTGGDITASKVTKAKPYFAANATDVDMTTGRLNNQANSGASNVQVEILDANKATQPAIDLTGDVDAQAITAKDITGSASVDYHFVARYYATGEATAGDVTAYVNYNITYE